MKVTHHKFILKEGSRTDQAVNFINDMMHDDEAFVCEIEMPPLKWRAGMSWREVSIDASHLNADYVINKVNEIAFKKRGPTKISVFYEPNPIHSNNSVNGGSRGHYNPPLFAPHMTREVKPPPPKIENETTVVEPTKTARAGGFGGNATFIDDLT